MLETQILLIAVGRRSNPRPSRIFATSRLISIFLLRAAFCRVLASVCEAKVCLCCTCDQLSEL